MIVKIVYYFNCPKTRKLNYVDTITLLLVFKYLILSVIDSISYIIIPTTNVWFLSFIDLYNNIIIVNYKYLLFTVNGIKL